MIRSDKRLRLCRCLMAAILCFIWGNSMLPANSSLSLSEWVRMVLTDSIPIRAGEINWASVFVRKLAHFVEFGALGVCMAWHHGMLEKKQLRGFAACVLAACIDESIQFFSPGRAPGLYDVIIDSMGAGCGMLLLIFGHTYLKKRSTQKQLEDK